MAKNYRLSAAALRPIVIGFGSCIASDAITVQGEKVGFMYRESPEESGDSGWRFLSGTETQDFLNSPDNLAIYDVNTIANYDPAIVPLLASPIGSAFERLPGSDIFEPADAPSG